MDDIDIVLPVRNGETTIEDAVQSILDQTYRNFLLFIVDDGSTDNTSAILARLASQDDRIRIISGTGTGIVAALNLGISVGQAPLVARLDADDLSTPDRLCQQVKAFDRRPNLVLLGTCIEWFGAKQGTPGIVTGAKKCRLALGLFTPFCHPSVMMRRSALNALNHQIYDSNFEYSEDWELFSRLSKLGEVDNLKNVLLRYRIHENQISNTKKDVQISAQSQISKIHQRDVLNITSLPSEILFWFKLFFVLNPVNWRQVFRAIRRRINHLV